MGESQITAQSLERVRLNAAKCRELANTALTPDGRDVLAELAEQYERNAESRERSERHRRPRSPFRWSLP